MTSVTYLVDGVGDGARRQLTGQSEYRPAVSTRGDLIVVPGRHGAVPAGVARLEASTLALEWEVWGATATQMEAEREALVSLLAHPAGVTITRRLDGAGGQVAAARLKSIGAGTAQYATPLTVVPAVFEIPAGVWRDAAATTTAAVAAATDVTAALTALAGGSAPITDAVVRVQGPATGITVTDVVSGTGLSWTGALAAGEYLFMDAAALTARRTTSSTAWDAGGTAVSGTLDYPAAGPLLLWPRMAATDPTDRRVTIRVTGTGRAATTAVTIRARRAYL